MFLKKDDETLIQNKLVGKTDFVQVLEEPSGLMFQQSCD
jgi:hypothetical protein